MALGGPRPDSMSAARKLSRVGRKGITDIIIGCQLKGASRETRRCCATKISISIHFENVGSNVREVKVIIDKEGSSFVEDVPSVSVAALPTVTTAVASRKRGLPLYFVGLPTCLNDPEIFEGNLEIPPDLYNVCNIIFDLKKAGNNEFRLLKMMGDSLLKTVIYQHLFRIGERAELESKAQRALRNDAECAMATFFDTHFLSLHNEKYPNEMNISPHGKCDVIEAILEYSRANPQHTDVLVYTFSKLIPFTK